MQPSKFNIILDGHHGSSGKGKISTYLAHKHNVRHVSSANYPNAGHSYIDGYHKFVAKAIPTAAALHSVYHQNIDCYISPGSGFSWPRLITEWNETGRPNILIHDRASVVTDEHKAREQSGRDSTKHVASTMQGTATAISDKILRKREVLLAGYSPELGGETTVRYWIEYMIRTEPAMKEFFSSAVNTGEVLDKITIVKSEKFREITRAKIQDGETWLHEGSQGYALSVDHGSHYPNCTSRNCSTQAAMDYMAIPPSMVGDVYINFRVNPIRVGNVVEDGVQMGYSGDTYPDSMEITWDQVAKFSGMPPEEAAKLAERERTTVTKRVRRVFTFSFGSVPDIVQTNGATKLSLNFVQYLNWKDNGIRGGKEALEKLSSDTRHFIEQLENVSNLPVVLIGTGADHKDIIDLS